MNTVRLGIDTRIKYKNAENGDGEDYILQFLGKKLEKGHRHKPLVLWVLVYAAVKDPQGPRPRFLNHRSRSHI